MATRLLVAGRVVHSRSRYGARLSRARRISRYVAKPSESEGHEEVTITLTRLSPKEVEEIVRDLAKIPGVKRVVRQG